jgi:ribosomal protein S7
MTQVNNINSSVYLSYFHTKLSVFQKTYFFFQLKKKIFYSMIYSNIGVLYYLIYIFIKCNNLNKIEYEDKKNNHILNKQTKINMYKLIRICTKKGKKKISFNIIKNSLLLIKKYFFINPFLFLSLAIKKTEYFLKIQILKIKSRQKIIPRLLFPEQRKNLSLRIIVNHAKKNIHNYKCFYISLANSIIYYSLININNTTDPIILNIHDVNEQALLNKYLVFKKKKRKKFKIIKKYIK